MHSVVLQAEETDAWKTPAFIFPCFLTVDATRQLPHTSTSVASPPQGSVYLQTVSQSKAFPVGHFVTAMRRVALAFPGAPMKDPLVKNLLSLLVLAPHWQGKNKKPDALRWLIMKGEPVVPSRSIPHPLTPASPLHSSNTPQVPLTPNRPPWGWSL